MADYNGNYDGSKIAREFFFAEPVAKVPPVPAVEIYRADWERIQSIIGELLEIGELSEGRDMDTTLISGSVLKQTVADAKELRRYAKDITK